MNQSWTRRHLIVTGAALLVAGCSTRGGSRGGGGSGSASGSKGFWYVVQPGDTLASISARSGVATQTIVDVNQLSVQTGAVNSRLKNMTGSGAAADDDFRPGRSLWLPGVASLAPGTVIARGEPVEPEAPDVVPVPQGEPEPLPGDLPEAPAGGYVLVPRSSWTKAAVGSRNQAMGGVQRITIHHTDEHAGTAGLPDVELIRRIENYHRTGRKWCAIGYHYIVGKDGRVYEGRPARYQGAHVLSENENNLGISIVGNFTSHLPNQRQLAALRSFLDDSRDKYRVSKRNVFGHRDLNKSECPGDALYAWLKTKYKA